MLDVTCTLMRRLREPDTEKLGIFFARNNRPDVTTFFNPFPLNENVSRDLLEPARKDLFFVIEENGRFLAFSMLRGQDEGYDIPSFGIFVDWEHQSCGIGKRLSEWTFRWADQAGVPKIRLSVYEENIQARTFYERSGFIETERIRGVDGRVSVIMHRMGPNNTKPKVFASTQALPSDETLAQRLRRWSDVGIHNIELSNYSIEDENHFLNDASRFPGELLIHHFFPSNRNSAVLNLASEDPTCRNDTFHFFQRSIEWSAEIGAPFFSFHAGYVTDPIGRDSHGFVLAEPTTGSYEIAWDRFSTGVEALCKLASETGVRLLIENNVVSESNKAKLLLGKPNEFVRFFGQSGMCDNVGMLLDWGHWLVTANTYQLALDSFLSLSDRIYGIHLHSNDGRADEHLPFHADYSDLNTVRSYNPEFVSLEGHYQTINVLQKDILAMEKAFA